MWQRLSKMATGLVSVDPDALQAENLELKHELHSLTEDYELLKEAHKKALEQLSPQESHTSRDLHFFLPSQEYAILKESNSKLSNQLSTLSAVVKIESAQLYQSLSKERLELAKIREELNAREFQLRDREIACQTAQMLQTSTDTDLASILSKNLQLNDSLQSLKAENESLRCELNEVKVGYIQNSNKKNRDCIPVRYSQIIAKLQQQLMQVRAVQKDQSFRLMVEEAEGYFMNEMKSFEKKWWNLVYRMGSLQKELKEMKDRNIKGKKESEKEMNDVIRKYELQIKEIQLENEKLKNLLVEKENQIIAEKAGKKSEYYTEPVVKTYKPKVEKEEQFFDIESVPKESSKPSFTQVLLTQSSQEFRNSTSIPIIPSQVPKQPIQSASLPAAPNESSNPSLSTFLPVPLSETHKPLSNPCEHSKECSILESLPVASSLLDCVQESSPLSKESPSEELKLSPLDFEKLPAPRQPLLKKVPRMVARGINLRSSKPAADDIDLEEILGSSAPSIDQLKKTLGNFKS